MNMEAFSVQVVVATQLGRGITIHVRLQSAYNKSYFKLYIFAVHLFLL